MTYQIDQSGKMEDTSRHTAIAYSNDVSGSVIISAREKRRLQERFRLVGQPRLFVDMTFAIAIYSLIKPIVKLRPIFIIDTEYPGHTKVIQEMIQALLPFEVDIRWALVGKNSKAHDIAYKTYKKKIPATQKLTADGVWRLAKKIAGGRLNSGLSPESRRSVPTTTYTIAQKTSKIKKKTKRRKYA